MKFRRLVVESTTLVCALVICTSLSSIGSCEGKKRSSGKGETSVKSNVEQNESEVKDENDPTQAFLSYGNNPLHNAARDGNLDLVRKILDRVPGVFRDARFSKWEYDDPEDYPDHGDKNDVIYTLP